MQVLNVPVGDTGTFPGLKGSQGHVQVPNADQCPASTQLARVCAQPLQHSVEVKCLHDPSAYKALKSLGGLALLPGFPLTG